MASGGSVPVSVPPFAAIVIGGTGDIGRNLVGSLLQAKVKE